MDINSFYGRDCEFTSQHRLAVLAEVLWISSFILSKCGDSMTTSMSVLVQCSLSILPHDVQSGLLTLTKEPQKMK